MTKKIFSIFRNHPDYLFITIGILLSTIGMALTTIAVYSILSQNNASPEFYGITFVLEITPGVITSHFARKYLAHVNMAKLIVLAEFLGGLAILVSIFGTISGSLPLILFAACVGSGVAGFLLPFHNTYMRRILADDEIEAIAVLSTYTFATTFIFGTLLGTICYSLVEPTTYFIIDACTYFISCLFSVYAWRIRSDAFLPMSKIGEKSIDFDYKSLTPLQKRAFGLNLIMAVNCAPATALLPSIAHRLGTPMDFGSVVIMPVLILLILKTLGQLLGPVLIRNSNFDHLFKNSFIVPAALMVFHFFYILIFNSTSLSIIVPSVILAHTASNVVFILGFYALRRYFDEGIIGAASVLQNQLSIGVMAASALLAGYIAKQFGYNYILAFTAVCWLAYVVFSLKMQSTTSIKAYNEG